MCRHFYVRAVNALYELIYAWTQQLVFLILFVTVVEMILPAGELRRYTKMILGLVVILAILDPLLQFVRTGLDGSVAGRFRRPGHGDRGSRGGGGRQIFLRAASDTSQPV